MHLGRAAEAETERPLDTCMLRVPGDELHLMSPPARRVPMPRPMLPARTIVTFIRPPPQPSKSHAELLDGSAGDVGKMPTRRHVAQCGVVSSLPRIPKRSACAAPSDLSTPMTIKPWSLRHPASFAHLPWLRIMTSQVPIDAN